MAEQDRIAELTQMVATLTAQVTTLTDTVNRLQARLNQAAEIQTRDQEMEPPEGQARQQINIQAIDLPRAQRFAQLQMSNPRVAQLTRTKAFDTLSFIDSVPQEAMEVPQISSVVKSRLVADTATLLNGERFGNWVKTSIAAQDLVVPASKQPDLQYSSENPPQRRGKRGGARHYGRGGSRGK